jgi:Holliday junction DNA helicase RuvA
MIGYLSGKVQDKFPASVILLTGGVGYETLIPPSTLSSVTVGDSLKLYIYTHVREDTLALYGFKTKEELFLFNLLLEVPGIGPKTALLVVDKGVEKIKQAIAKADVDFFSLIPRLGRKNSQKIIIELKNKLGGLIELDLAGESSETLEAIEALQAMGYTKPQAIGALRMVPESLNTVEEKIKYALKILVRKNHD